MKKEINNEQTKEKTLINTLKTICLIFSWSSFMIDKSHYIGLDVLFKRMKPYYYCICWDFVFNELVPLGITIAPTEYFMKE